MTQDATQTKNITKRIIHMDNLNTFPEMAFTGYYDMPVLHPCYDLPRLLMPFSMALTSKSYDATVHFYIHDYQFERIWRALGRYVECLRRYKSVISPDYSQYVDMPYAQRLWNNYRGKFVGAVLQTKGISIIPNVTWSLPDSFEYCFDGLPQNSIIAINSIGVVKYGLCRYRWLKGYEEAIKRLNPKTIVRYGPIVSGEDESRSVYFQNERILILRKHGW